MLVIAFLKVVPDFWSLLFSGAAAEKLLKFKKWFWSIVEKMSNSDRQDLVSAKKNCYTFTSVFGFQVVAGFAVLMELRKNVWNTNFTKAPGKLIGISFFFLNHAL